MTREDIVAQIYRKYVGRVDDNQARQDTLYKCVVDYINAKPEPLQLTRKDFLNLESLCIKQTGARNNSFQHTAATTRSSEVGPRQ